MENKNRYIINFESNIGKHRSDIEILDKKENKISEVMSVEELEKYEPKNMAEQEYQDWFWD